MNLPKACEILKADLLEPGSVDKLDFQDAEQLGIEALKREMLFRERVPKKEWSLLPGETE